MNNKWLWKVLIIPAILLLALGLVGLLYPYMYMDFYLGQSANTTIAAVYASQPEMALLLDALFRANGLGMTMSGVLAVFIIWFGVRNGTKWSIPALVIAGGIGLLGEILLEMMVLI
ncbi:MAG: hypothetical protein ACK2UB_05305 [Anaerolineales bacterium]